VATSSFSKYVDRLLGGADSLGGAGGLNRLDRSDSAVLLVISNWIDVECLGFGLAFSFFVGEGLSSRLDETVVVSTGFAEVLGSVSFPLVTDDILLILVVL